MTVGWRSPLGGPRYEGDIPGDEDRVEEWPEERIRQHELEIERGRATVEPEGEQTELRADGGLVEATPDDVEEAVGEAGLPEIHVGDHVTDREDDDGATMLVVGTPIEHAAEHDVGDGTVADFNPGYPADDDVLEVVYPQRTDVSTRPMSRYAFPRSRLELETPVHDRGDSDE